MKLDELLIKNKTEVIPFLSEEEEKNLLKLVVLLDNFKKLCEDIKNDKIC
jgi:hypothetical protein